MRNIDLSSERDFENLKTNDPTTRKSQSKYYWSIQTYIDKHEKECLQEISGKDVLEIGCATGKAAASRAGVASSYTGIDISDEAIKIGKQRKIPNATFIVSDGHKIPTPDGVFDCVIVDGLLHHMDLATVFREINRVLRDDGSLIFREPLGTNLLFQLYRKLTPSARTVDERPFTFEDIRLMKQYFVVTKLSWYGLFCIFSAFVKSRHLRQVLCVVDNILAMTPAKYFYWHFSGIVKRRQRECTNNS